MDVTPQTDTKTSKVVELFLVCALTCIDWLSGPGNSDPWRMLYLEKQGRALNFLAHLLISDSSDEALIGSLLGDFVKGNPAGRYSDAITEAILLHRRVDTFADAHPVTRDSRNRISRHWRRFAGVIIDVCYDHFLARHWQGFTSEDLASFTDRVYGVLKRHRAVLPLRLNRILPVMAAEDWLGGYAHIQRVAATLDRIAGRLTNGKRFMGAIADVHANYSALEGDFLTFFPELVAFCNDGEQVGLRKPIPSTPHQNRRHQGVGNKWA